MKLDRALLASVALSLASGCASSASLGARPASSGTAELTSAEVPTPPQTPAPRVGKSQRSAAPIPPEDDAQTEPKPRADGPRVDGPRSGAGFSGWKR